MDQESQDTVERLKRWAESTVSVRAAAMVGSRAEADCQLDELSDFDVVLFLDPDHELGQDGSWVKSFGPVLVALATEYSSDDERLPTRLVQYGDGKRIDFTLAPVSILESIRGRGRLPDWLDAGFRVLVDKDDLLSGLPEASGAAYVPEPPTEERFSEVVNEFWWEVLYVAKGIARGEPLTSKYSEHVVRFECLLPMLEWYVQGAGDWRKPVGAVGRGIMRLLPESERHLLLKTLPGATPHEQWEALEATVHLFRRAAATVASALGYLYPETLDAEVSDRLVEIRGRYPDSQWS